MNGFSAEPVLAELKDFQRDAVEHVIHRFFGDPNSSGRFLVADETGLGKSVVARGVIARTIERLQHDDTVKRIDIVYICSNQDLASQNLRRLNVTGDPHIGLTSRLTLLARESRRLNEATSAHGKPINLVSFTPGTSFEMGWRTGTGDERALLHLILTDMLELSRPEQRASRMFFQGTIRTKSAFDWRIRNMLYELKGPVDPNIVAAFQKSITESGLQDDYLTTIRSFAFKSTIPAGVTNHVWHLTSKLRGALAAASVDTLTPDLIILDEFQRFRHLLDVDQGSDAAELAHALFNYSSAKVLLLSATPYKPFTQASDDTGDDHYADLMATLNFLIDGSDVSLADIRGGFAEYRDQVVNNHVVNSSIDLLRDRLLTVMSRTERPQIGAGDMLRERRLESAAPEAEDLAGYIALEELSTELEAPTGIEYWKSIPYFASFMDNYKVSKALDRRLAESPGDLETHINALQRLNADAIESFSEIDLGNSHLRALAAETIDQGWWKLLWMPPSLPYFNPGNVYDSVASGSVTKRVVFSAWSATPTAIASLLSYEADRRTAKGSRLTDNSATARKSIRGRLIYSLSTDTEKPASMSTLALFWPHPGLAKVGDPLRLVRGAKANIPASEAEVTLAKVLATGEDVGFAWEAFFAAPGAIPTGLTENPAELTQLLRAHPRDGTDEQDEQTAGSRHTAHTAHIVQAMETIEAAQSPTAHPELARLALHAPGNIGFRALGRLREEDDATSDAGQWRAAAMLGNGLRSLFNRANSMLLLDQIKQADEESYWQVVLDYCADGNLQASLDEYAFQLRSEAAGTALTDEMLMNIAERMVQAMTMRPSTYRARDFDAEDAHIPLTARFALRYGGKDQNEESARQPEIRHAFNSPFWPFVLASTSVGQEGIDFHWWSHAVLHWNVPSNPVDFEQREGRVNRFAGHAVRKNIAAAHREQVFASSDPNPWRAAFAAAADSHKELGEFSPFWIYPGEAKVERQLVSFPLSRDLARTDRLKESLALYRLTLGQPRQEDMLEILRRRGISDSTVATLDLRPPRREETAGP
ncbi:helicase-related protein [Homoserinimonas sp. OAct 916]|uniref:helicase-related protein n=1 Tax=Homoserinimonas sp. OAct 916 TaxID=2211450 RepID=UPI000DBE31B2|nr:helicase-related protein [Homoserinimonas sp. OAct 916]